MLNVRKIIRYYFGPFSRLPHIPVIVVENDGFSVNGHKVRINEIISAYYRNEFSPNNTALPIVGASYYEILTIKETLFFYGEHENLSQFFSQHLEIESRFESNLLGLCIRWKKTGRSYQPVSIRDQSIRFSENLSNWHISKKWLWFVLLIALAICVLSLITFTKLMF